MDRRMFMTSLAVVPTVSVLPGSTTVGKVTPDTHRKARVWVDGVEVSSRCFEADDERGYAKVYCRDEQYHDPREVRGPAHVIYGGHVRWEMRDGQAVQVYPPPGRSNICTHVLLGHVEIRRA